MGPIASLRRMFTVALGWPEPPWLAQGGGDMARTRHRARVRAAIPVWRDPWMVVGSDTFTGDVAARLGLDNIYAGHPERYPHVSLGDLVARQPESSCCPTSRTRSARATGRKCSPVIGRR